MRSREGERAAGAEQGPGEGSNLASDFLALKFYLDPIVNLHAGPAPRNEKFWEPLATGTLEESGVLGGRRTMAQDNWGLILGKGRQLTQEGQ